jgi:transposase
MSRMRQNSEEEQGVFGGVDTHDQTHHAAVVDGLGRQLGDQEFPTTSQGIGRC